MAYPKDSIKTELKYSNFLLNKKVVIVGPSFHMKGWRQGELIDSYDLTVRLSKGYEINNNFKSKDISKYSKEKKYNIGKEVELDFGSKVDILYQTLLSNWGNGINLPIKKLKDELKWICASFPDDRHKEFIKDFIKYNNNRIPFHIMNKKYWQNIKKQMGTIPSVGASAIFDLLKFDIKELYITGFTFYLIKNKNGFFYYPDYFYKNSKQLKDNRPHGKHDHFKIFKYIKKIAKQDNRIKCDKVLEGLIDKYD